MKEVLEELFSRSMGIRKNILTLLKSVKVKAGQKVFFYGSNDITNRYNLNCKRCYWNKNFVELDTHLSNLDHLKGLFGEIIIPEAVLDGCIMEDGTAVEENR